MEQVRVGLIGCGGMGKSLVNGMLNIPAARLVAVSDVNDDTARKYAAEHNIAWYTDHRDLLAQLDVDAVIIAVPNKWHAPVTIDAAHAGKHVFCEKPMAMNEEECCAMIAACKNAGVKLQIGQVLRYNPDFARAIAMVKNGELGDVFHGYIARYGNPGGLRGGWRGDPTIVGNWLLEVSVHEIDFARCIFGKPVAVTAWMQDRFPQGTIKPDACDMVVEFEDGGVCHLVMGQFSTLGRLEVELSGTGGSVRFHWGHDFVWKKLGDENETSLTRAEIGCGAEPAVQREVREWIECILRDTPETIPGQEGMENIRVVDAACLSSCEKRRVLLA